MLVAPAGWPTQVRPPDAPDWERTACTWLLDICPPEYRGYAALRKHPVVLARVGALHVDGAMLAVRRGLSEARSELRDVADHATIDDALATLHTEEARLLRLRREVALVEEALRGRRFRARL